MSINIHVDLSQVKCFTLKLNVVIYFDFWRGWNSITSIVAAVDSICKKRQKSFLIQGELTEANKALCSFSER